MGNYITASSPVLTVCTTNGDISNKLNAGKEQFKENLSYAGKSLGAGLIMGAATAGTLASKTATDVFAKGVDKAVSTTAKVAYKILPKKGGKVAINLAQAIKKAPKVGKILVPMLLLATAVGNHIRSQHNYNQGKIDQKYETIAKMRDKINANV